MKTLISFLPKAAAYFFILLFCYAAVSKLLDYENFQVQLAQSPLLSAYAGIVAWAVIAAELFIVILLAFPATLRAGLYASFGLMVAFTVYIYLILNYSDFVPCSCGGILEKMGWTEHLIFNAAAVLLSIVGIWATYRSGTTAEFQRMRFTRPAIILILIGSFSTAVMIALFLSSEHIIKEGKEFTRRILPHPLVEQEVLNLEKGGFYIAGYSEDELYLGNHGSPLEITTINLSSRNIRSNFLHIDDKGEMYRMLKIIVMAPSIYVYDGTVPVIYKGTVGNTATTEISRNQAYFNQIAVTNNAGFIIRTRSSSTKEYLLGLLHPDSNPALQLRGGVLEKQVDGVFDSDGQLLFDASSDQILYTYAFRNQYIVMNSSGQILRKLRTIDPFDKVQITSISLSNGQHKIGAPALRINKLQAVYRGILFNISGVMSKSESRKKWRKSTVVDLYRTDRQEYIGSFYLPFSNSVSGILVTNDFFFVLNGTNLNIYRYRDVIKKHFDRGSRKPINRVGKSL